jgi:DNA-binding NarL/FixJ family response regulator
MRVSVVAEHGLLADLVAAALRDETALVVTTVAGGVAALEGRRRSGTLGSGVLLFAASHPPELGLLRWVSDEERLSVASGRALVIADLCGCIGLVRALQLGARGYVGPEERLEVLAPRVLQAGSGFLAVPPGPADALRIAMRVLVRESTAVRRLSETDLDVMRWLSRGETAGEIANRLNVSESAVRNRIRRIMVRLEVRNEKELSAVAATAGLYEPRTPAAV